MGGIVERNIRALLRRRAEDAARASREQRIAEVITRFTGSMRFVYIHLALFGTWIVWNLGPLGLPRFDPSYVVLAMTASVEAIFLSTFVLISQNRMNAQADERAELDLQICLLTEHEVTRILGLVVTIAERLGIDDVVDDEIAELEQDVRPEEVMETISTHRDLDGDDRP